MSKTSAVGALAQAFGMGTCGFCSDLGFRASFDRSHSQVTLMWRNERGTEPMLVNIGRLTGSIFSLGETTTIQISGPGLPSGTLVMRNQPAGVAGKITPFVICLLPGAEYELTLEGKDMRAPGSNKTLADLGERSWTLSVSFTGRQAVVVGPTGQFIPYDGVVEYGSRINLWTGQVQTVVTN